MVGATVGGIGSTFVLIVAFWLALVLSVPFSGVRALYVRVATAVGAASLRVFLDAYGLVG